MQTKELSHPQPHVCWDPGLLCVLFLFYSYSWTWLFVSSDSQAPLERAHIGAGQWGTQAPAHTIIWRYKDVIVYNNLQYTSFIINTKGRHTQFFFISRTTQRGSVKKENTFFKGKNKIYEPIRSGGGDDGKQSICIRLSNINQWFWQQY